MWMAHFPTRREKNRPQRPSHNNNNNHAPETKSLRSCCQASSERKVCRAWTCMLCDFGVFEAKTISVDLRMCRSLFRLTVYNTRTDSVVTILAEYLWAAPVASRKWPMIGAVSVLAGSGVLDGEGACRWAAIAPLWYAIMVPHIPYKRVTDWLEYRLKILQPDTWLNVI